MQNDSHYNKTLKNFARELRNDSTLGEVILWNKVLKAKGTGYQFNRQFTLQISDKKIIIVDFICRKLKLIIEVDGASHNYKGKEDKLRDERLEELGYTVLRFSERDIHFDIDNVVRDLENVIETLKEKIK